MSMHPQPWPGVPEQTARIAKRAFPKGSLAIRARDELGSWYEDEDFADVFGVRGAPGISPAQLAMVTVLQFTENLTDRQAADEVRGRIDWKYCLGLELEDGGFDFSVLSGFRGRLVEGGRERVLFDRLLDRLKELGLVKAGGRQRTDSTHVLGRIRDLNRLELAGETVRAALEALAAAAPAWLAGIIGPSWQRVYGQRIDNWRLPDSQTAREELAVQYGRDGYWLLEQVHGPAAPGWLRELPAVQVLRRIWIQQYYQDGEKVVRREEREHGLPPGRDRLASPYDLDARYSEKHGMSWTGYKDSLTETAGDPAGDDPGTGRPAVPNLVTDVETTHAAVPDVVLTAPAQERLAARDLLPGEHDVDSGYISADLLVSSRARGVVLVGPLLADTSPQARAGGYTAAMFTIDWDSRQATCPEGSLSGKWAPMRQRDGKEAVSVRFAAAACGPCPARDKCTTAVRTGRQLFLRPREIHEAVAAARAEEGTRQWKDRYKARAGVEGLMGQASHVTGIRHARYTGLPKTRLEHLASATAINVIRLDAWYTCKPIDRTRTTHLQRLDVTAAA
ncbi:MAG TPA: IS1182 family transposase [Trebonia sp.]|jgi:transposase|nr:IS1182 family transposase [Trebonia sp.]